MSTQGEKIKHFRRISKIKQEQIAKLLDMSQSNYSRIENDEILPSDEALKKLADLFNVSKEQLEEMETNVSFNNCNQANYKPNSIHNYTISEELKQLYEDKITLLEEKIAYLQK